jgi:hypothetical protein
VWTEVISLRLRTPLHHFSAFPDNFCREAPTYHLQAGRLVLLLLPLIICSLHETNRWPLPLFSFVAGARETDERFRRARPRWSVSRCVHFMFVCLYVWWVRGSVANCLYTYKYRYIIYIYIYIVYIYILYMRKSPPAPSHYCSPTKHGPISQKKNKQTSNGASFHSGVYSKKRCIEKSFWCFW